VARYLDTGAGDREQCLGVWLQRNVASDILGFRAQFGYFRFAAFSPFASILRDVGARGNAVHLVLGSNNGGLPADDLRSTFEVVQGTANSSLTVVAYRNAAFHPKTAHVTRGDGSVAAIVGSANLTQHGTGWNVEASMALDSREGDASDLLDGIAAAIDWWRGVTTAGVFTIAQPGDIDRLVADGLVNVPQPEAPRLPGGARSHRARARAGTRRRLWGRSTPRRRGSGRPGVRARGRATAPLRWWKQLAPSDAQQVTGRTNPTGKLRLAKAGHDIDHKTFFRRRMFRGVRWRRETRGGKRYEVADVEFDIVVRGRFLGTMALRVDHAPHRVADQNNVPTILAWGSGLCSLLRSASYVGDWVVIERRGDGTFALTIQQDQPS